MKGPIQKKYHKCISAKAYKSSVTKEVIKIGSLTDVAVANVPRIISSGFMTQAFIWNEKSAVFECLQKLQDYCELLTPRKECENAPEKNVTCNLCSKVFVLEIEKTYHFKGVHSTKLKCNFPDCKSTAHTQKTLEIHQKIHTKPEDELYKCRICEKVFLFKSGLDTHMHSHSNTHYYQCTICDKTFKHAGLLTCHAQTCGLSAEFYKCVFVDCDYSNQNMDKTNIKFTHIMFTHANSDRFVCKKCHDLFEFKENYLHYRRTCQGNK